MKFSRKGIFIVGYNVISQFSEIKFLKVDI